APLPASPFSEVPCGGSEGSEEEARPWVTRRSDPFSRSASYSSTRPSWAGGGVTRFGGASGNCWRAVVKATRCPFGLSARSQTCPLRGTFGSLLTTFHSSV